MGFTSNCCSEKRQIQILLFVPEPFCVLNVQIEKKRDAFILNQKMMLQFD